MSGYPLLNSEFNDFLFAPIGEEENEMSLSVISALARLGIDPRQEAARLTRLPRELATRSLAATIDELPSGRWAPSDSREIAARLVQLLPSPNNSRIPPVTHNGDLRRMIRLMVVMWLLYTAVWGATLMMAGNLEQPPGIGHNSTHVTDTSPSPRVSSQGGD